MDGDLMALVNLKLLGKMLAVIVAVMLVVAFASIGSGRDLAWLAILVPIGLFAFVIFKFKKSGIVAVIGVIGTLFIFATPFTDTIRGALVPLVAGAILISISLMLRRRWKVDPAAQKQNAGGSAPAGQSKQ